MNEVDGDVTNETDGTIIQWIWGMDLFRQGFEPCTPSWPTTNAIFYLGHGRMGRVPDYPWIEYEYKPEWSSSKFEKDNPAEYMRTFLEMILALQHARGARGEIDYSRIDQDIVNLKQNISGVLPAISDILGAKPIDVRNQDDAVNKRCDFWRNELRNGGRLSSLELPQEYDPDHWVNVARASDKIVDTDYYKFNAAAIDHFNRVSYNLLDSGIKKEICTWHFGEENQSFTMQYECGHESGQLSGGLLVPARSGEWQPIIVNDIAGINGRIPNIENIWITENIPGQIYSYTIWIKGGCEEGKWDSYLFFTDRSGDEYSIELIIVRPRDHWLAYNSNNPAITGIRWQIEDLAT